MARRSAARQLTERDLDILRWVGQGGLASLDQLARRFWPGKQMETALDRLRQLVKAGYLETHICDVRNPGERVFSLTRQGALQLDASLQGRLYVGLPAVAEVKQQLLAQEAYLKLEMQAREGGAQLVEWQSERWLRAEFLRTQHHAKRRRQASLEMDIPDARVVIQTAHGDREILHVEIDGAYYGKMLRQKAARLTEAGQKVIWVCTQARAEYVQRAVADYPNIHVLDV